MVERENQGQQTAVGGRGSLLAPVDVAVQIHSNHWGP